MKYLIREKNPKTIKNNASVYMHLKYLSHPQIFNDFKLILTQT